MQTSIIRSTGSWVPEDIITNEELVASYNSYAERFNSDNAAAIAAGEMDEVPLSSAEFIVNASGICLLYTSPSPRDATLSRMPSSA